MLITDLNYTDFFCWIKRSNNFSLFRVHEVVPTLAGLQSVPEVGRRATRGASAPLPTYLVSSIALNIVVGVVKQAVRRIAGDRYGKTRAGVWGRVLLLQVRRTIRDTRLTFIPVNPSQGANQTQRSSGVAPYPLGSTASGNLARAREAS